MNRISSQSYNRLLLTKMCMPQKSPTLIDRPRISEALDAAAGGSLTMVVAPAGYGKTTATANWIRQRKLSSAWLSLDSGENDPVLFWSYLTAAINTALPEIPPEVPGSVTNIEETVSALINSLYTCPDNLVLVLDDFHLITEPIVHESLAMLIHYLPANVHLVILSRLEPPWPPSAVRDVARFHRITAADLRFDKPETAALYERLKLQVPESEIEILNARTEGWAMGLYLACFSLRQGECGYSLLTDFSGDNQMLARYFMSQVLDSCSEEARDFLLKTSILDRIGGPLCDALCGKNNSLQILQALAESNSFIAPLDGGHHWYRYHHLFADFLRNELRERWGSLHDMLHQKAAGWYENNHLLPEAINHYLQGKYYHQAGLLIELNAPDIYRKGGKATLSNWLQQLPFAVVRQSVMLCLIRAWTALPELIPDALHWQERAETAMGEFAFKCQDQEWQEQMGYEVAFIKAYLALLTLDVPAWIQLFTKVRSYGNRKSLLPLPYIYFNHFEVSLLGGPMHFYGRLNINTDILNTCPDIIEMVRSTFADSERKGYLPVARAELAYEQNDLEEAVRQLMVGLAEASAAGNDGALVPGIFTLARIKRARGDLAGALEVVEQGKARLQALAKFGWLPRLEALKASLDLDRGNLEAARKWMASSRLNMYDRISAEREYEQIILARCLIATGAWERAALLLASLEAFTEQQQRLPGLIEVLNLQALACQAQRQKCRAIGFLDRSLAIAEANGYLRIVIDEGAPILALLGKLVWQVRSRPDQVQTSAAYALRLQRLLRKELLSPGAQIDTTSTPPHSLSGELFTRREREVLQLLIGGGSYKEIAAQLKIALPTLKTHVSNIFSKLGVKNRTQAVRLAVELQDRDRNEN